SRRVEVHHEEGAPGSSEVFMTLDTADAAAFDSTVSTMAATMRALGHPGDLGVCRAHAVGVLADPQQALDLLAAADIADPDRPLDPDHDPAVCFAEDAAYATPTPFRGSNGAGEAVVVFHVTDRDLLDPDGSGLLRRDGVARSPRLGPVLTSRLHSWLLTAGTVTIKPVLDIQAMPAVDQHDPPARMAEAVRLRDETCVYPRCGRRAEVCDLDHIDEYIPLDQGGPPGQTHPDNLAPLCRRHHRAKTFAHFSYRRLADGSYEWTLPTGTQVTTDPNMPRPAPPPRRRRT
ncbi:HNH endonuclease signature motif containing protein, partial [Nocardioides astragali]